MQRAILEYEGGNYDGSKFLQAATVALAAHTPSDGDHAEALVVRFLNLRAALEARYRQIGS